MEKCEEENIEKGSKAEARDVEGGEHCHCRMLSSNYALKPGAQGAGDKVPCFCREGGWIQGYSLTVRILEEMYSQE